MSCACFFSDFVRDLTLSLPRLPQRMIRIPSGSAVFSPKSVFQESAVQGILFLSPVEGTLFIFQTCICCSFLPEGPVLVLNLQPVSLPLNQSWSALNISRWQEVGILLYYCNRSLPSSDFPSNTCSVVVNGLNYFWRYTAGSSGCTHAEWCGRLEVDSWAFLLFE